MPIYAARWPDFSLSIVEARCPREFFSYLDELDSPNCVTYKRLENPLFITLKVDHVEEEGEKEKVDSEPFNLGEILMKNEEYCDGTAIVNGTKVKLHKSVFASRSTYFANLFKVFDEITITETSVQVVKLLKEYFYTNNIKDIDLEMEISLLKYALVIDCPDLVKKMASCIRRETVRNYYSKIEHLVLAYRATENVLEELNGEIKQKLIDKLKNKNSFLEENNGNHFDIIKNIDAELADDLQLEIDDSIAAKTKLEAMKKEFKDILIDYEAKDFSTKITKFMERKLADGEQGMENILNPYYVMVSHFLSKNNSSKELNKLLKAIQLLSKYNFNVDKMEKLYHGEDEDCKSSPLYQVSMNGLLDIVKALVNIGSDPLQRIRPNGTTILHVLHDSIKQSQSVYDKALANPLLFPGNSRSSNPNGVREVFHWLMASKGFNNIEEVPCQDLQKPVKIRDDYVDSLLRGFDTGYPCVPFKIAACEGDTEDEFIQAINAFMHPRVAALASTIDEESYPHEDDTELRRNVKELTKKDVLEAGRAYHPDRKCRKMTDPKDSDSDLDDDDDDMDTDMDSSDLFSILLRQCEP